MCVFSGHLVNNYCPSYNLLLEIDYCISISKILIKKEVLHVWPFKNEVTFIKPYHWTSTYHKADLDENKIINTIKDISKDGLEIVIKT